MTQWRDLPGAPSPGTVLVESAAVADDAAVPVAFGDKPRFRAIVTRSGGVVRAYVNLCPHFRVPLTMEGRDVTISPGLIWCGIHAAQFRKEDGRCVDGPAKGASLTPIPVVEVDGAVVIADVEADPEP